MHNRLCLLITVVLTANSVYGIQAFKTENSYIPGDTGNSLLLAAGSTVYDTLSCPDPSPEAVALFRYLQDMSGKRILSGQMWAPWGIDELNYLQSVTGKLPAVRGADLITESANNTEIQNLVNWWNKGGIPTLMWHWGAPGVGEGYENSKVEIDIDKCFIEGTTEYNEMWRELKLKADHLEVLRDAHVPVLWRPLHELNGSWFWWGKQGPERFKKLWRTMYDYFVHDRGLNNLIWVLCYMDTPDSDWYPGDEYVDIAGADTYNGGADVHKAMYESVRSIIGNDAAPVAYHECGVPPNPDRCIEQGVMWSWWMIWHTTWLTGNDKTYLKYVFNHELVITLDEVPDIMAVYGWDDTCKPASITPSLNVDEKGWQDETTVFADSGNMVTFRAASDMEGNWSWSGCGLNGTGSQQAVSMDGPCTATAEFVNTCGAVTSQTFNIINYCTSTKINPYLQKDGGTWLNSSTVSLVPGTTTLSLAPRVVGEGTWRWSGCDLSGTDRVQTFIPSYPCSAKANYTNNCGETSSCTFVISECNPSIITPNARVASQPWTLGPDIQADAETYVLFSPYTLAEGTWSWNGCGLSGTAREQYVKADTSCSATVTFTNDCGLTSTYVYFLDVTSDSSSGIERNNGLPGLKIYPDPASVTIHLELPAGFSSSSFRLSIYTASGVLVRQMKVESSNPVIDITALPADLYFIRLSNGKHFLTGRFIKSE